MHSLILCIREAAAAATSCRNGVTALPRSLIPETRIINELVVYSTSQRTWIDIYHVGARPLVYSNLLTDGANPISELNSLMTADLETFFSKLSHGPLMVVHNSIEADTRWGRIDACNMNINLSSAIVHGCRI